MSKFKFDKATVDKFHNHGWLVSTDIKPACCFCLYKPEELDLAKAYFSDVFPDLKLLIEEQTTDQEYCMMIHVYRYDHIRTVIEEIYSGRLSEVLVHTLSGYVYGIPPHKVEEFLYANR